MRVVTWNVNGVRACIRKGALARMADALEPDVLCLQETRADLDGPAGDALCDELGFLEAFYSTNPSSAGYSGTAIVGNRLATAPRRDVWLYENEGRVAGALVRDTFVLLSVYAPNTGKNERLPYKEQFFERLGDECAWLCRQGYSVVLAGDFNAVQNELDVHDWNGTLDEAGNRSEEREALRALLHRRGTHFVDIWRESHPDTRQYTWWDQRTRARQRNRGWRIDSFIVDAALRDASCTIHDDIEGSDHCPVVLDLPAKR